MVALKLALMFLKANWKWVAVLLAAASLLGYVEVIRLERDHYKKEYQTVTLKLDTLVKSSKVKEDQLDADNAAITAKYRNTLKDANTLVTENARVNSENIKNAKELASVKLSLNAVRLFNASKQSATEEAKPATTIEGNDGKASVASQATLEDMLQVVNTNDANHLKCIKQVEEWQAFWEDHFATVEAVNAQ